MCAGLLSGCGNTSSAEVLNVYNWGEYIDTDLIDQFEEETGIKVIYNTFDSNENLYSRIQTTSYDVIIPSDYAISRFIDEDMLQPLNYDHIPNMKLIDEKYTHLDFDPDAERIPFPTPGRWSRSCTTPSTLIKRILARGICCGTPNIHQPHRHVQQLT